MTTSRGMDIEIPPLRKHNGSPPLARVLFPRPGRRALDGRSTRLHRGVIARHTPAKAAPMEKTRATQVEALREQFQKHGVRKVKLGGFDGDGVLRGKYVSLDKFWSVAEGGLGFCDVIFGWDMSDQLYDRATVTGWHTGYPDTHATVDLSTFRLIPWEPGTAAFLLDFEAEAGKPLAVSPRQLLRRVEDKARSMGFSLKVASEYEVLLLRET